MKSADRQRARIALEDGIVFSGFSFGAGGEKSGEVVFNTSLTGYQEILTDPSYKGQIVVMTYPLIGNYGVNSDDVESRKVFLEGFIVKERSRIVSNWRAQKSLCQYLEENNVMGMEGIDTRCLTRHIRLQGAMRGVISTRDDSDKALVEKAKNSPGLVGRDLAGEVAIDKAYQWNEDGRYKVTVIDCGVKFNILRNLQKAGCRVTVVPYDRSAADILKEKPNGVVLSNGPGDPAAVKYVSATICALLGKVPILGICLGHQILGIALGGKTSKLKFGHHGGNQPVKDLKTGKVAITSQNHGFCLDIRKKSEDKYFMVGNDAVEITHINLNDNTCEGIRHKSLPAVSVQFHPEAGPGPNDAVYLFREFVEMMVNYNQICLKEPTLKKY